MSETGKSAAQPDNTLCFKEKKEEERTTTKPEGIQRNSSSYAIETVSKIVTGQ